MLESVAKSSRKAKDDVRTSQQAQGHVQRVVVIQSAAFICEPDISRIRMRPAYPCVYTYLNNGQYARQVIPSPYCI